MKKTDEVLNRAYGHISKEVTPLLDFNLYPTWRGVKYYWLTLIRKLTR